MVINRQALMELFVNFNTIFNKTLDETQPQYLKVAMEVPSSSSDENYAWFGQLPSMREWLGDRVVQNLSASSYAIKNKDFELTIAVNRNDIQDDKVGIYRPLVQDMAQTVSRHPDELVFSLLAQGFANRCYDEQYFFDTDHPHETTNGIISQSNKGLKKLSVQSYGEARAHMMTIKGKGDKTLKIVPDLLVVSPQNEAIAREILFAELIANSTNVYKNTCELLVVPELADYPDQWYLLCTKRAIKPLVFQNRQKPNFVSLDKDNDSNVFFSKEYIYGADTRCNAGYGLWQLAYGSTGEQA